MTACRAMLAALSPGRSARDQSIAIRGVCTGAVAGAAPPAQIAASRIRKVRNIALSYLRPLWYVFAMTVRGITYHALRKGVNDEQATADRIRRRWSHPGRCHEPFAGR